MRYIDKSIRLAEFDDFIIEFDSRLRKWDELKKKRSKENVKGGEIQLSLFQHLWQQQKGLCIYCQQEIPEKSAPYTNAEAIIAQLEHVCPQSVCDNLIFEQNNIAVSCEGFNLSEATPLEKRREFCGHYKDNLRKGNVYDTAKFLNPTELTDVESFFTYDFNGDILANKAKNNEEIINAEYMIKTLGLQNETLITMRTQQYNIWLEDSILNGEDWLKENLNDTFQTLPAFYSMLKEKFL